GTLRHARPSNAGSRRDCSGSRTIGGKTIGAIDEKRETEDGHEWVEEKDTGSSVFRLSSFVSPRTMLIHATITVTGDPVLLAACDARLKRLLAGLVLQNAVTEHHGADGLCYDLKVEG